MRFINAKRKFSVGILFLYQMKNLFSRKNDLLSFIYQGVYSDINVRNGEVNLKKMFSNVSAHVLNLKLFPPI